MLKPDRQLLSRTDVKVTSFLWPEEKLQLLPSHFIHGVLKRKGY